MAKKEVSGNRSDVITLENFSENNRSRTIGNSLYRICNTDLQEGKGKWYIHEQYTDETTWCSNSAHHTDNLEEVINRINSFTKEREVISLRFKESEV